MTPVMKKREPGSHGIDTEVVSNLQQRALSASIHAIRVDARALLRHLKATRDEYGRFVKLGLTDDFIQEVIGVSRWHLGERRQSCIQQWR